MACHLRDQFGVYMSARSPDCLSLFDDAAMDLLAWTGTPGAKISRALEIDPKFTMGNVMKVGLGLIANIQQQGETIDKAMIQMKESISKDCTPAELSHVDALQLWAAGDFRQAAATWNSILVDNPTDVVALKFAHDTFFFTSDAEFIRDVLARTYDVWKNEYRMNPAYGFITGMYAFALEETNYYERAEKMGKEAVELNPCDAWATHAVAHVMDMQSRISEGISWLEETQRWRECDSLSTHLNWHTALMYLELEKGEEVLNIYDTRIRKENKASPLDLVDASSLLYRCELLGIDVGDRWEHLMNLWMDHMDNRGLTFGDLNAMMAALRSSKHSGSAEKLLDSMRDFASKYGDSPNVYHGPVYKNSGVPLSEAMMAYNSQDYASAVRELFPKPDITRGIGGSAAQRDVFNIMTIQAALKGGEWPKARALTAHRVQFRPLSPLSWKWYGEALTGLGTSEKEQWRNMGEQGKNAMECYKTLLKQHQGAHKPASARQPQNK